MTMPDTRGWALIGLYGLAFYLFTLIAIVPGISKDELFSVLATAVVSGGLGGALGFFFGSSKGSADKDSVVADAVAKAPDQSK